MQDDFDNHMGLPEDELTGGSAMSDAGELGIGGMEDEIDAGAPGRPSGGARARKSSGSPKRAAVPAARKAATKKSVSRGAKKRSAKKKSAKKKSVKKSTGARKASRKGSKRSARGKKKGGRRR